MWGGGGENRQWEKKVRQSVRWQKKQLNKKKRGRAGAKTGQERLEKGCGAAAQMQDESYLFVES